MDTLFTKGPLTFSEPVSFADATVVVDPMPAVWATFAIICNFFPAMLAGAAAIFTDGKASSDVITGFNATCGLLGGFATLPAFLPTSSFLLTEQWLNWSLNTVASVLGIIDAASELPPPPPRRWSPGCPGAAASG
jgi:fluoride ion exporter CrcB/FEX